MNENYRTFFGFTREPFASDLALKEILQTEELTGVQKRFDYALRLGGIGLVTGEIGSGKSTALRYAAGKLHPSEYQTLYVVASSGSILELYRQIAAELGITQSSTSKALITSLAIQKPKSMEELERIGELKNWQKKEFGKSILEVLNGCP